MGFNSGFKGLNDLLRSKRVFQNDGTENSDIGESPKRKNTTFTTWWEFEIKNVL